MSNKFLKPNSVNLPPIGARTITGSGSWVYTPRVVLLEDSSLAGLQAQLDAEVSASAVDPERYYVIESVSYQTVSPSNNEVRYSVCIHATQVTME